MRKRNRWSKLAALFMCCILAGTMLTACGRRNAGGVGKETPEQSAAASATPEQSAAASATPGQSAVSSVTPTPAKPEQQTFQIGDTAVFDNLRISATELKESEGAQYMKAKDGKVFVGVNFTIENISDKEQPISSLLLFDAYEDNVKSSYSIGAAMAFESQTLDGTIAPGKKMVGWYAIEANQGWKQIELQVKNAWLSGDKATFVFNKQ